MALGREIQRAGAAGLYGDGCFGVGFWAWAKGRVPYLLPLMPCTDGKDPGYVRGKCPGVSVPGPLNVGPPRRGGGPFLPQRGPPREGGDVLGLCSGLFLLGLGLSEDVTAGTSHV